MDSKVEKHRSSPINIIKKFQSKWTPELVRLSFSRTVANTHHSMRALHIRQRVNTSMLFVAISCTRWTQLFGPKQTQSKAKNSRAGCTWLRPRNVNKTRKLCTLLIQKIYICTRLVALDLLDESGNLFCLGTGDKKLRERLVLAKLFQNH